MKLQTLLESRKDTKMTEHYLNNLSKVERYNSKNVKIIYVGNYC